eukprot:scaffold3068_cov401-Prasinococcus_capsulatus_cf.AAC.46
MRTLTVKGHGKTLVIPWMICCRRFGLSSNAEPPPFSHIISMGHLQEAQHRVQLQTRRTFCAKGIISGRHPARWGKPAVNVNEVTLHVI